MDWKTLGMQVVDNALGVFATEAVGVSKMLEKQNDSQVVKSVKMGLLWTLIDELILYMRTGNAHLLNGDYYFWVDNTFFNTAVWQLLSTNGLGARLDTALDGINPVGGEIGSSINTAVVKVGAKTLQDLIDTNWLDTPLKYLTHISVLLR